MQNAINKCVPYILLTSFKFILIINFFYSTSASASLDHLEQSDFIGTELTTAQYKTYSDMISECVAISLITTWANKKNTEIEEKKMESIFTTLLYMIADEAIRNKLNNVMTEDEIEGTYQMHMKSFYNRYPVETKSSLKKYIRCTIWIGAMKNRVLPNLIEGQLVPEESFLHHMLKPDHPEILLGVDQNYESFSNHVKERFLNDWMAAGGPNDIWEILKP